MSIFRQSFMLLLSVGLVLAALSGCNSSPTGTTAVMNYRVAGTLVQEMNVDHAFAAARLWRNDSVLTSGLVRFAAVPMAFFPDYQDIDSAYQALISPAASHAGTQAFFRVADASRFADSVLTNVVDTFSITDNVDPANHQLQGAGQVSLEWTAAANAVGYILAAVKADTAYSGVGYSAPVATVGTAGTIPPEAFLDPISSTADTGLYNIYVYAYSGAPDSALAGAFLPVPLPSQPADNIDHNRFDGRFGTITVTARDTIRVVATQ